MKSLKYTGLLAVFLSAAVFVTPADANPCKSHFQKLSSTLKKVGPPIAKLICKLTAGEKKDQSKVKKCNEDYAKAVAKIDSLSKTYNKKAGSGKIGPRGLGFNATYSGTLLAERV